jgi:DNA-binding MarR family transcriptional regulator
MVSLIPNYLWKDLSRLFSKYSYEEFNFQNALDLLTSDYNYTSQKLSKLEKSGYISIRQDPSDGRRRFYRINKVKFEDIMKDIGNGSNDE